LEFDISRNCRIRGQSILKHALLAIRSFIAARRVAAVDTDARDRRIADAIAPFPTVSRDGRDSRSFIT